jgi:hypothetical protein
MEIEFLLKFVDILAGLLVLTANAKSLEGPATMCFSMARMKCK